MKAAGRGVSDETFLLILLLLSPSLSLWGLS